MQTNNDTTEGKPIASRAFIGLAATEFWERFAMAGVKSILTIVLIDHLLPDGDDEIGIASSRALVTWLFGPVSVTAFASQIYGFCNALIYLAIPIGGLLGDLFVGRRGAVLLAGLMMAAGLGLVIGRTGFLPGLILFALGTGMLKGNLSAQVGLLFADGSARRQGYSIYLACLNGGIIFGPLAAGTALTMAGWRAGFASALVAVLVAVASYWCLFPKHSGRTGALPSATRAEPGFRPPGSTSLLIAAIMSVYLCFAAYEQIGNIFLIWSRAHVDLALGGWSMPVAWLISLDGLITILLIAATQIAFRRLRANGVEIGDATQIALGCLSCALGYLVLVAATLTAGEDRVSPAWIIAYLLLIDLAVVLVWPAGLSLVTGIAPARLTAFWVGIFYLHGAFASLWAGLSGVQYERLAPTHFWLLHAGLAAAGALLAFHVARRIGAGQAITTSA